MGVCTHPRFACREQHLIYFDCPNLHWDEISIVMLCARFFLAKISFALGSNLLNNMPQGRLTVFVTPSNKPQDFVAKVLRFVVFLVPVVRHAVYGGARRDRTVDLLRARQALSQLSYSPKILSLGLFW